ncbi:MAG: glycosyltransferase family 39 protein [Candidatus Saccharibacteria bacterium]
MAMAGIREKLKRPEYIVALLALAFGVIATAYSFRHGYILAYGDSESHLNIAKRVISSLTPGFAQLGGVWLPLPHVLMIPFVASDRLWRTGLAGSIVSGLAYVISCLYVYKLAFRITKNAPAGFAAFLVFALNPNILYMQSTPMTELPLICFEMLSCYYFVRFLYEERELESLLLAALFGFLAALSRYDGWFLVGFEAAAFVLLYLTRKRFREKAVGQFILFSTLAFFGVVLWLGWNKIILGDPLYFVHSQYSAGAQQQFFLQKGQLQAYHNLKMAFLYYFVTSLENVGGIVYILGAVGLLLYLARRPKVNRLLLVLVLGTPFAFYVATMYLGQSIIFIPAITPANFDWRLFNVRYGIMMVPLVSVFFAYLFFKSSRPVKIWLSSMILLQLSLFAFGRFPIVTLQDGIVGLSHAKKPDAERWLALNYDGGLLLLDDYARTISIIRSNVPMQDVIYVGTKPYWEESLDRPEKYPTWIVMQKDDEVWTRIYQNPVKQAELYKYFIKVYTSPEILIFKRNPQVAAQ